MMSSCIRVTLSAILLTGLISFAGLPASSARAQANAGAFPSAWNNRFVPDDAFAVILASPQELLQNDAFASFPVEMFQVQLKTAFGVDPGDISQVKIILGLPDPRQPAFGIVLELTQPFDESWVLQAMQADIEPTPIGNVTAHPIAVGPPGTVLHQVDDKTIVIALSTYLPSMLAAKQGAGPLPTLMAQTPAKPGVNLLLVMESVRSVISPIAIDLARMLPPEFLRLAELPELAESVQLNFVFSGNAAKLDLTLTGLDDAAVGRTEKILTDAIADARNFVPELMRRSMPVPGGSDEMRAAIETYAERLTRQIFNAIATKRAGQHVRLTVESKLGITSGIVIANVMPSIDRILRSLTRQMDSSNNFKMVLLAMHNYHDTYNRFPAPAITDADGKPLLSWRVALLPFLEEQALYQQFRLNEPWDSEHNLPLSKRMPKVFATAGLRLPPGQTVVHASVGELIGLRPKEPTGLRDFRDGTSNTILILESTLDSAVPWSKPEDVKIDLEDPLAKFIGSPKKSFQVGMGDGSVRRLPDDIDPTMFKAMLTRAGGEVIRP